jgi:hypothetical protein
VPTLDRLLGIKFENRVKPLLLTKDLCNTVIRGDVDSIIA